MRRVLLVFLVILWGCASDSVDPPSNTDMGIADVGRNNLAWNLPQAKYAWSDYLELSERLCFSGGDRSKKVFSIQALSYHRGADYLTFRNGNGRYLFVNEACEAWIMIGRGQGLGDSYLQLPAHKQFTREEFAILLENYRVLEFPDFGITGFTRLLRPDMLLFEVDGLHLALGQDYARDYLDESSGERLDWTTDLTFEDHELLAIAILRYSFWEDTELLDGAVSYRGERLWFTAHLETGPDFFPARLVQDWPLESGPEEMGVVAKGCSHFGSLSGDEADKFRELRDRMLAMEPKDSYGHWAVPMKWGDKTYLVEMAEGFPLEDDEGFIPWMDLRMVYFDCSDL